MEYLLKTGKCDLRLRGSFLFPTRCSLVAQPIFNLMHFLDIILHSFSTLHFPRTVFNLSRSIKGIITLRLRLRLSLVCKAGCLLDIYIISLSLPFTKLDSLIPSARTLQTPRSILFHDHRLHPSIHTVSLPACQSKLHSKASSSGLASFVSKHNSTLHSCRRQHILPNPRSPSFSTPLDIA